MEPLSPPALDAIPRLGWIEAPTPVTPLPRTADALGLAYLGVKRDDLGEPFHGGNKPRKLDYLLAAPPFVDAPAWASAGGIGSGSLVALTGAAERLGRRLDAHVFWTPLSEGVVENLAFTASGPTTLHFYGSRLALALRRPAVLIGARSRGLPVVAPGATSPLGMIGSARGGLELAAQVRAGELPEPERVYVALGSGGTAVGIAMGLALGGLGSTVVAVAVVERALSLRARLRALERALAAELARAGVPVPAAPLPIVVERGHLGLGYAHPTAESLAACAALAAEGIDLEPVYTGKAMAALLAGASRVGARNVVFWSTVRRGPLPHNPAWRERLPAPLRRRLDAAGSAGVTRRHVLLAAAAAVAATVAVRVSGYPELPSFHGAVLARWEAHVLHAAAEALLGDAATAAELASIPERVDRYLTGVPPSVKRELHAMLALVEHGTTPLARHLSRLTRLPVAEREAFLAGLEARGGLFSQAYRGLRDLCVLALYQQPSTWPALGYDGPRVPLDYDPRGPDRWAWPAYDALVAPPSRAPAGRDAMIFDASTLPLPLRLKADLCVVGSGAGGAMAAMIAAEAGLSVVVLEAGEYLTPADMVQREEEMLPRLYWDAAGRTTTDRAVKIHQGRGVGGSTLHNLNLCKRIPLGIRDRWARERRLEHLPAAAWDALYDEVELLLQVSAVPRERWNRHNLLLEAGCKALGWAGGGLSHNRTGCIGSGFCELGCAYDGKNNAAKVLIPRAVKAGAEVLARCQAVRVRHARGAAHGVEARVLEPRTNRPIGEVLVEAARVCLSGSATATPAILLRSGVPDPGGETGDHLRVHPAVVVAGDFDEPVRAWDGIPQTYECTEHLQLDRDDGHRVWIVPAFAHPVGTAALVPGHGAPHRDIMRRYAHLGALTAMIHDHTRGRVRPDGDLGLSIDYWPDEGDRRELLHGLRACVALMFASGARRVVVPSHPARVYERGASLADLDALELTPGVMDLTAVHPMASVPMGDGPSAAVDSRGAHHHLSGLWIADGSLFPSSIGVPPQLSIYAMGLHVGRAIARS